MVGDFSRLADLEDQPQDLGNHARYLVVIFILQLGIPSAADQATIA